MVSPETVLEPFFLQTEYGRRFCIYRGPERIERCRAAYVYVPAFAEEMHKSRRMSSVQAREFAARGIATVHIDLYGTGDSDGEFEGARWDMWRNDVFAAWRWLEGRTGVAPGLWGLRLGASLAAAVAHEKAVQVPHTVLWQPVANGELFLTQFLRLRVAAEMLSGGAERADTRKLRDRLFAGESLEVAGYTLSSALAQAISAFRLTENVPCTSRCDWIEVGASDEVDVSPAIKRVLEAWRSDRLATVVTHTVGETFWATAEICECPQLIAETTRLCIERT